MNNKNTSLNSLSIKNKLLLLVAVVCFSFAVILALSIYNLYEVKALSTGVVQKQMNSLTENSQNSRDLSLLFNQIHLLNLQLHDSTPNLVAIEASLDKQINEVVSKLDDQQLKTELYVLQSQLYGVIETYKTVDHLIFRNAEVEGQLYGLIDQLEVDISELEIELISAKKTLSPAQQLNSLAFNIRESFYQISQINASQKVFMMSPSGHTLNETSVPIIQKLIERVEALPEDLPLSGYYQAVFRERLGVFLEGSQRLYSALKLFKVLMDNLDAQEGRLLDIIKNDDERTNQQAGSLMRYLEEMISQSAITILMMALVVITAMLVTMVLIIRNSIQHPIEKIEQGVESLASGKLDSRIELYSNDELSRIGDALNNMASALHESYSELKDSEDKFYQVFENEVNALLIFDQDTGKCLDANRISLGLYQVSLDEIKNLSITDIEPASIETDLLSSYTDDWIQTYHKKSDGSLFPVEVHTGDFIRKGRRYIFKSIRDLTEQLRLEGAQQQSAALLEATLESTIEGIIAVTNEGEITNFNRQFINIFKLEPDALVNGNIRDIVKPLSQYLKDKNTFFDLLKSATGHFNSANDSLVLEFTDGRMFECHFHQQLLNGEAVGRVWCFRDVSEYFNIMNQLKEKEIRLEHIAHHDSLTGLPNRLLFLDRLEHAINSARRAKEKVAVFFIDLDRFKSINDSLGHQVGDMLLKNFAARLKSSVRQNDTIGRLGGDEFTLILESVDDPVGAAKVADKILDSLNEPFHAGEYQFYVTSSIGISFYPDDGESANELLKNADAAMYKSKDAGRNTYHFYTKEMTEKAMEQVLIESSLREALEQEQFVVYYQPQIDLNTGRFLGAEALVRWLHPKQGLLSPEDFLPVADETGLIDEIDTWVFRHVCRQVVAWQQQGVDLSEMRFAVNLSGRQLRHKNLPETYQEIAEEEGCDPCYLELEISEGFVMHEPEASVEVMDRFNALGFELSIDDFGTGYSSLAYLKRLPLSKLKIDRSFVQDIVVDPNDEAISRSVIALGHSMNLKIVAEGVETDEQKSFLHVEGCDMGQGFLFSKPIHPDQLLQEMSTHGVNMKHAI